jgi:hypothetical protein
MISAGLAGLALAAAVAAVAAVAVLAFPSRLFAGASFERTIPVPRHSAASLGWSSGGCTVRSVTLRNYPSAEDIQKARSSDPDDKSWVWWDFHVENRGNEKCRISLVVDVYDKSGHVVKSSDKSDTVDDHKLDDNISVSTRMRTLDIADAPRAHIRAQIGRD